MSGVHWVQFATTCGSFAAVAAAVSAIYFPWSSRREARRTAALAATVQSAVAEIKVDMIARVDKSDRKTKRQLAELRANGAATDMQLATQFGGNGGGMREAINKQGEALAALAGRFDQHVTEAGESQ